MIRRGKRLVLLLLVVTLFSAASSSNERGSDPATKVDVRPYAGCYRITLGRWWPWGYGEEAKYVTPPNSIRLMPERGTEGFEKDQLLIRVFPLPRTSSARGGSFWDVQGSDVYMIWTDGFAGVSLKLEKRGGQLVGWAHPHFDSWRLIPHVARAKAQPIPCR